MNKRFRLVTLCLAMLVVLFFSTTKAFAASTVIRIDADKTEVQAGETVILSVVLGPVSDMGTMQMIIVVPEGLTYVEGSGKLADGLKNALGYDYADFTEASMMVNGVASKADYSSDGDTLLCTIQCVADEDFSGTVEVGLRKLEFYSCQNWQDHTSDYSVSKAVITISGDDTPVEPGSSDDGGSGGQTQPGGNTEPGSSGDGGSGEQTQPGGNTEPGSSGDGGSGEQTQPGGNTEPGSSGDGGSGGQTQPGGNTEPGSSGDGESGEQTQPGGNTEPGSSGGNEGTSTDKQPDDKKSEDGTQSESDSGNKTPEGTDTPSGNEDGASGEEGQKQPDSASEGTTDNTPDKEKNPETDNNSHQDSENRSQRTLWGAVIAAAVAVIAALMIILMRKKRKE